MGWVLWLMVRMPLLGGALIVVHAGVIIWKATDPRYLHIAEWFTVNLLRPLHMGAVWLVGKTFPMFTTLVGNTPPTHVDFDKFIFGVVTPILVWVVYNLLRGLVWLVTDRSDH